MGMSAYRCVGRATWMWVDHGYLRPGSGSAGTGNWQNSIRLARQGRCPRLVLAPRWGSWQYAVNLDDLSPERGGPNEPGAVPVAFGQPPQAARHVLDRGGRGVQSPADRPEEGGVFGRERLHPNVPRTEVSNAGPTP
jgi:hypothetical protein